MRNLDLSKTDKPTIEVPANEQAELLAKMEPLTTPALSVIRRNIAAKKVCVMCATKEPKKLNVSGRCISCDGAGMTDDFDKQKWAAEQVLGRKLPMPKAVEMRISDNKDKEELAKAFKDFSEDDVESMLSSLNKRLRDNRKADVTIHEIAEEA